MMWNDTDQPLAYLLTFRCYGTWLHGDERGSFNRFQNIYNSPAIAANKLLENYNRLRLKNEPVSLHAAQRQSIENGFRETCSVREWLLRSISVRTNHVHAVLSIGDANPKLAMTALKANATRQMRQDNNWQNKHSPWSEYGSKKYLWNERSIELANDYVIGGQGGDLTDFC